MKVIVHTKPACMPCRAVKRWLDRHLGPDSYIEVPITEAGAELWKAQGILASPVVELPGEPPHGGYRPDVLERWLASRTGPV